MLEYIKIEALRPHPHNPRRQLGDLSELTESVRESGVLQNLTVVPAAPDTLEEDKPRGRRRPRKDEAPDAIYTVVIGHRRLAAAQAAGLETVPCIVADMDERQQMATMLAENVQRCDLTAQEQAQGIQMMLDLGESVAEVVRRTGFSESTVRRRMRLMELDQEVLQKAEARGGTLEDYTRLDKIQDIGRRNSVLAHIGTSNFDYKLRNALDEEKRAARRAEITAFLDTFARQLEAEPKHNEMRRVQLFYTDGSKIKLEAPEDAKTGGYCYHGYAWGAVGLYVPWPEGEAPPAPAVRPQLSDEEKAALEARDRQLQDIAARAFGLRKDFVTDYTGARAEYPVVMELAAKALISWIDIDEELFVEALGLAVPTNEDGDPVGDVDLYALATEQTQGKIAAVLLAAAWATLDGEKQNYITYRTCKHQENAELDAVYDALCQLGYQMSDEEKAMRDGSHELLIQEEGTA